MVKKVILWVVGVLVAIVAIVYIAFQVSPLPGVLIMQRAFSGDVVTDKERYGRTISKVSVDRDVSYPSDYSENTVDIFYPKGEKNEKHPVLFWLHGGDSAGAQIAAQFVATQTKSTYLSEFNLGQILDPEQIKGAVLYCGLYDLKEVLGQKSDDRFTKFFVNTVGWSLTGQKNWQDSQAIKQASVVDYITDKFPPTFVTDGNSYSFQEQGLTLVDRLKELNVPVTSLFFNDSDKEVTHKYQFHFTDPLAQKCYDMTKEFTASLF